MRYIIPILVVLIALFILFLILKQRETEHFIFVRENSKALHALEEINKLYSFSSIDNIKYAYTYDNENFYDQISCEDYLIYQIRFDQREIRQKINVALDAEYLIGLHI